MIIGSPRPVGLMLGQAFADGRIIEEHIILPIGWLDWSGVEAVADRLAAHEHTVTIFDEHGAIMTIGSDSE